MNILIAYPTFPEPDTNAGSVRIWEIIQCLRRQQHQLAFLADYPNAPRYRAALEGQGVVCAEANAAQFHTSAAALGDFLRDGQFDVAICGHYPTYVRFAPLIRAFLPRCPLILDTVDLHFVRLEREAALTDSASARETARVAKLEETRAVAEADQVWVVTDAEQQALAPFAAAADVRVIPTIHEVQAERSGFERRQGIVFLGSYAHPPNVDAVRYLMNDVVPLLRRHLPEAPITIAGSNPSPEILAYAATAGVRVAGFVQDHRALLGGQRVGVAPLRYGAGMKGKIGEYFACGLPCVTTSIGAEGMHLRHESEALLADDPAAFATAVARLYTDRTLWERLAAAGIDYLEKRVTPRAVEPLVLAAVNEATRRKSWQCLQPLRTLWSLVNPFWVVRNGRHLWNARRRGGVREVMAIIRVNTRPQST